MKAIKTKITETDVNSLARVAFAGMADYFKDPEHEKAFQEWKQKRYGKVT